MKRTTITALATMMIVYLSSFSSPLDKGRTPIGRAINYEIGGEFTFDLYAGEKAIFKVTSDAVDEHQVRISSGIVGSRVIAHKPFGASIKDVIFEVTNNSPAKGYVNLYDYLPPHKAKASIRVVRQDKNYALLAFEDGPDNDYNDIFVEITIVEP